MHDDCCLKHDEMCLLIFKAHLSKLQYISHLKQVEDLSPQIGVSLDILPD